MYNDRQLSYKKMWVQKIDQFMAYLEKNPVPNSIYDEKRLKMLSGVKSFLTNYIIKPESYDYVSMFCVADIFKRLALGLPFYEITDSPEEWSDVIDNHEQERIMYQAKRYPSLFKIVDNNTGEVYYQDINRFEGTYKNRRYIHFHSGLIDRVLRPIFPITMPYYPTADNIKVTTEDFLVDPRNGDFDTFGIFYAEDPYSGIRQINKFFKEDSKSDFGWKEISRLEYLLRKLVKIDSNSELAHHIRKKQYLLLAKKMVTPMIEDYVRSDIQATEKMFEQLSQTDNPNMIEVDKDATNNSQMFRLWSPA